jgi:predicted AlkP superfamily phosphohydrolase/phosphomutase
MLKYFGMLVVLIGVGALVWNVLPGAENNQVTNVYWFIPDGTRADPDIFKIYEWAEEGKLPNIKKMMEEGSYGYSIPDFPSHTPTNFASLLTGTHPKTHGVADGPMHVEGYPLATPSVAGFGSAAKRVDPIWKILEAVGKKVALLSIPGSTPPELQNGITIRGRWAPWGFDTPALIFEPMEMLKERKSAGRGFKLFYLGQKLTQFIETGTVSGWENPPKSFSPAKEMKMSAHGATIWGLVYDSTDDNATNYDQVLFSLDKKTPIATLDEGEWSEWTPVTLAWKEAPVASDMRIKVIKLWDTGNFRVRLFFNNINEFLTQPSSVAGELTANVGPMVDFVDNWPAQLIYEEEDKDAFLEEAEMSLDWHKRAAGFIWDTYQPDVFIHDTYTPNQMLESRWWHRQIAGPNFDYNTRATAADEWDDIFWLYKKLDDILGEVLAKADRNTLVVFSSDHGVIPIKKQFKINNLFAEKGWLKYTIDPTTGEPVIDWAKSKVVYLKMAYVYVKPEGLGGEWTRGSGPAYEQLRTEVIAALSELKDSDGVSPVVHVAKWEEAPEYFELPADRIGDLVVQVTPGYQLWEEVDAGGRIFEEPLGGGYKQAIDPLTTKGMWTPFVVMGPGVRRGYAMTEPIRHVDQMPTILRLLNIPVPEHVEGRVMEEILR